MIQGPILIVSILLLIEIVILFLSEHAHFKKYFRFLPAVFWIYFIPMLVSSLGLIDSQSPLYSKITNYFLPASLFLLLISVDLKSIFHLGNSALVMFFAGSFGIMLGIVSVFAIFRRWVGDDFWTGFGALAGSWTGGSANLIAVKEALATPDAVFLPMVIVDTIVPYVWMGLLVAASSWQHVFDRFNRSDLAVLEKIDQ